MRHVLIKQALVIFFLILFVPAKAQISEGGIPPGMDVGMKSAFEAHYIVPIHFDVAALLEEDALLAEDNLPPRLGVNIPLDMDLAQHGTRLSLPDGQEIIQLKIEAPNALALMLIYDKFIIPEGGRLFIYNQESEHIIGAFTHKTNPARRSFATEFVLGDKLVMEYLIPSGGELPEIVISGLSYGYNHFPMADERKSRALSGWCEVNVNCSEGDNWQDHKRGVAKVVMIMNGYASCCSGTMINNTAQDFDPLYLSAHHCFESVNTADLDKMIFYFNYELPGCEVDTEIDPDAPTIVGARYVVDVNFYNGSDGALLRLNEQVPAEWNIYFNGWDRKNEPGRSGVGIHHPNGDIKKISTYTSPTVSGTWNYNVGATDAHWQVKYAQTENGWGATEGGSSGSPLFNQEGLVIGTLTGSNYSATVNGQVIPCYNLTDGSAYYGKLWYHWDQAYQKMKDYLDPLNTGVDELQGAYVDYRTFLADFELPTPGVYITQKLQIENNSFGAKTYEWSFPGADIESSNQEIPPVIVYNATGTYTISLTINKGDEDESTKSISFNVHRKENLCPEQVMIGVNSSLMSQYPLGSNLRQIISSSIYTVEEIGIGEESVIESLEWYATYKDGPERTLQIYLKETDEDTFSEASFWQDEIEEAVLVYQSPDNWKSGLGWNKLVLTKPFHYSGTKNLKVMVRAITTRYGNYKDPGCTYTLAESRHQTWTDEYYVSPILDPGTIGNQRPNIRINTGVLCGIDEPTADFTIDGSDEETVQVRTGKEIEFVSQSTGPVINFEWAFEGAIPDISLKENPTVVYTEPGTYKVLLKASNTIGTTTVEKTIKVIIQPPVADFISSSTGIYTYPGFAQSLPYQGGEVTFYDRSEYTPEGWEWTLVGAEPQYSAEQNVSVYYPAQPEAKQYPVVLSVTNQGGSNQLQKEEYVKIGGTAAIWNLPNGDSGENYYLSSDDNYLTGTNKDYTSIAEKFERPYPGTIDKVHVRMKVMEGNVNSLGYSVAIYSDKNGLPGNSIRSKAFTGKNIDADGHTTITFDEPAQVDGTFYVVIGGLSKNDNKVAIGASAQARGTIFIRQNNQWKKLSDYYGEEWTISLNVAPNFTYGLPSGGAPYDLSAIYDEENDKVLLSWKDNIWEEDDRLYYKVYRNGTEIATDTPGNTYEDNDLLKGTDICYTVSSVYSGATSWESDKSVASCLFIDPVDLHAINQEAAIVIYPNPVDEVLNIRSNEAMRNISISTIQGRIIRSIADNGNEAVIPVDDLSPESILSGFRQENG